MFIKRFNTIDSSNEHFKGRRKMNQQRKLAFSINESERLHEAVNASRKEKEHKHHPTYVIKTNTLEWPQSQQFSTFVKAFQWNSLPPNVLSKPSIKKREETVEKLREMNRYEMSRKDFALKVFKMIIDDIRKEMDLPSSDLTLYENVPVHCKVHQFGVDYMLDGIVEACYLVDGTESAPLLDKKCKISSSWEVDRVKERYECLKFQSHLREWPPSTEEFNPTTTGHREFSKNVVPSINIVYDDTRSHYLNVSQMIMLLYGLLSPAVRATKKPKASFGIVTNGTHCTIVGMQVNTTDLENLKNDQVVNDVWVHDLDIFSHSDEHVNAMGVFTLKNIGHFALSK